jgi:4-hydroxy-tetrahydrodipicolinate reductase
MEKKLILILFEKVKLLVNTKVKFSSGKEIITLNHEAFDRTLYSDGALAASEWLMKKKTRAIFYERFT